MVFNFNFQFHLFPQIHKRQYKLQSNIKALQQKMNLQRGVIKNHRGLSGIIPCLKLQYQNTIVFVFLYCNIKQGMYPFLGWICCTWFYNLLNTINNWVNLQIKGDLYDKMHLRFYKRNALPDVVVILPMRSGILSHVT